MIDTSSNDITQRAIAAGKVLLGRVLVINTDADLTPAGTRKLRIVSHTKGGRRTARHIRLYVAGKIFRNLPLTNDAIALANDWVAAA